MPYMTSVDMMFLIFVLFILVVVGIFFLIVSIGNFLFEDILVGFVSLVVFAACSGAAYFLLKKYRE